MITFQHLRPAHIDMAADVLSRAMVSNPIHGAVYQRCGEQERQTIKAEFQSLLTQRPGDVLLAFHQNEMVGVCRFRLCQGHRAIAPKMKALLQAKPTTLATIQQRERYWKATWHSHDPDSPHNHLGPIGVLPEWQHQGIGTQLMAEYCRFVDQKNIPAYLEADKAKNVRFYQQFGFSVIDKTDILGLENYFMWRDRATERDQS